MAMRRRYPTKYTRRVAPRSARKFRWAVVSGQGTIPPQTYVTVNLLEPVQPAPTIADLIYQQMTNPTLVAIMGQMTIAANPTYVAGVTKAPQASQGAWGIYVDKDFASLATALPAYSAGFTSTWMMHKPWYVSSALYLASGTGNAFAANDLNYRRYEISQRKYKRRLDSFNDTLILSIEHNSTVAQGAVDNVNYNFYFRLLLLE